MRKVLLSLPLTVIALAGHDVQAQTRTVTGQVQGADGAGLPGVTVVAKGTSVGTATDAEGRYSLAVPTSATTLIFSSVGFDSKEVAIGNQSAINATLNSAATGLDEVVVVGYGTGQSRRELTGAVSSISGGVVAQKPVQSFEQALQGQAPGLNITTPNGVLNNPPVVRIRGVNSVNLSSDPLYVIDGIPAFSGNSSAVANVANNPLSNLNPNDIESVEVLKDAAASAIYGSRAAGGVIQITTKKGRRGQSKVTLDSWVGWSNPVRLYDLLNADQYIEIKNEAVRNLNENRRAAGGVANNLEGAFRPTLDENGNTINTRWYDEVYRTGFSHSNNVGFSGGTEKTTFYSSVGYTGQQGMLEKNEFKRMSARLNIDHRVYKNFTVGARVSYSNSRNSSPNTGSVGDAAFSVAGLGRSPLVLPPNIPARNPDGTPNLTPQTANVGAGANLNPIPATTTPALTYTPLIPGYYNPIVDLDNNYFTSEGNEIQGSVYANWEIFSGLNARTNYGINNLAFEDKSFSTPIAGDGFSTGGSASNYYRTNKRWNWQNTLQYDRTLGEKHTFGLLVGTEQQKTDIQRWGATRTQVADIFFNTFQGNYTNISAAGNFQGENFLNSYFGRLTYDFSKKYLVSLNVRRDGYSAWAKKWGNFYGASAGYIISEEDFWKNAPFATAVSFLKFTGSYGEVGNANGITDFVSLATYGSGLYGASPTLYFSRPGNRNLTWETSKKTDIGMSFGLFEDKVTGDFAYYRNLVDGLILDAPTAPSRGIPAGSTGPGDFTTINSIAANIGSMRNTGIELNLRYNAIQGPNFTWTVSGNLTTQKNRVLNLVTEGQRISTSTSGLEIVNFTEAGRSVGEIVAVPTTGINPANGQRMFLKKIRNADGNVTDVREVQYNHQGAGTGWTFLDGTPAPAPTQQADGEYYGPTLPKWYGGLDNSFRFKNFDLGVFIQYSGGNYIYNGTRAGLHDQRFWNNDVDILDRWTPENTGGSWPRVVFNDNVSNGSALIMSSNVEKGDFLRLRNVSLGYTLNKDLITRFSMSSARFYVQVQNAALITNYSGIDPEISTNAGGTASNTGAGVDRNSVGQARTYTVGLNIGF